MILRSLLLIAVFVVPCQADWASDWLETELPGVVTLYQELHAAPELSLVEYETAERIATEWRACGFEVTTGVGGTGVVAVLENGGVEIRFRHRKGDKINAACGQLRRSTPPSVVALDANKAQN